MMKKFTFGLTPGVESLLDEFDDSFTLNDIQNLLQVAINYFKESYFISFKPNKLTTLVTDGNDNILEEILLYIPENIWMIQEESEAEVVVVAMLPSEY